MTALLAVEELRAKVRDVPDFPTPGVLFKDISPLLGDGAAWSSVIRRLAGQLRDTGVEKIAGIEARGFLLGAPIAAELGVGFVPIRKPGKLPWETTSVEYTLEYGFDTLEMHVDAFAPGERVVIVDDVLATGGTAAAAVELVTTARADLVGLAFLIELGFLGGRSRLDGRTIFSLLDY